MYCLLTLSSCIFSIPPQLRTWKLYFPVVLVLVSANGGGSHIGFPGGKNVKASFLLVATASAGMQTPIVPLPCFNPPAVDEVVFICGQHGLLPFVLLVFVYMCNQLPVLNLSAWKTLGAFCFPVCTLIDKPSSPYWLAMPGFFSIHFSIWTCNCFLILISMWPSLFPLVYSWIWLLRKTYLKAQLIVFCLLSPFPCILVKLSILLKRS